MLLCRRLIISGVVDVRSWGNEAGPDDYFVDDESEEFNVPFIHCLPSKYERPTRTRHLYDGLATASSKSEGTHHHLITRQQQG